MNTVQSSVLLRESVRAFLALFEPLTRVDSKTAHLSRSVTTFCGYGSPGPPPLYEREFIYIHRTHSSGILGVRISESLIQKRNS